MFDTFYNESLRKTVVAFGSLFDEIYVQRRDSDGNTTKKILVPITYSPKEKFMRMLDEYPLLKGEDSNVHIGQVLPRMGFNITSINYDPTRKRNTISKRYGATDTTGVFERQFAEVPYTVNFSLAIVTRTMDDALQIVEQILAYFTPEFTITLNYTSLNAKVDLPITIQSVTPEVQYDGDTTTQRTIVFNIDFAALSYIFSPIKTQKHITTTDITNFFAFFENDGSITGPTGAASRIISSITGPSGADSLPPVAGVTQEIFSYPNTLSVTGGTL